MICKRCLALGALSLPVGLGDLVLWEVGEQGSADCKLVAPK